MVKRTVCYFNLYTTRRKQEVIDYLPALHHLTNGDPSFRRDTHNLGNNSKRLISIKKCHSRDGVVDRADQCIPLFLQIAGYPFEFAHWQAECQMLCTSVGI